MSSPDDSNLDSATKAYHVYLDALRDNWSSGVAARMLTEPVVRKIADRFSQCTTSKQVRVLTSFLYLPDETRKQHRELLGQVALQAETDRDDWLKKLAKFVVPYVATGKINLKDIDSEVASHVIRFLDTHSADVQYYVRNPVEWPHVWDCRDDEIKHLSLDELLGLAKVSRMHDRDTCSFAPDPTTTDGLVAHILQEGVRQLKLVRR